MIEWDGDVEYEAPRACDCEGWQQENADGPWCGDCGHHISDHRDGPCDPEGDDG